MASITPPTKGYSGFSWTLSNQSAPSRIPISYFWNPQATVSICSSGKIFASGWKGWKNTPVSLTIKLWRQTSGQNLPLIGTDEVGNGSYFGGLTVVSCFVTWPARLLQKLDRVPETLMSKDQSDAPILRKNPAGALLLS